MPRPGYTVRSFGLTQKGMTATCDVCGGVGAVLAVPVEQALTVTYANFHNGEDLVDNNAAYVRDDIAVLIPCPGCFRG